MLAVPDDLKLRDLNTIARLSEYIENTVKGFISIAESPKAVGNVINIGSGKEISIGAHMVWLQRTLADDKTLPFYSFVPVDKGSQLQPGMNVQIALPFVQQVGVHIRINLVFILIK